jgi:hypothetical protein
MVLASLLVFTLVYGVLMFADIYLIVKYATKVSQPDADVTAVPQKPLPSFLGAQD